MYTIVTSLISVPRSELKPKVIDAPEILQVIEEIPHVAGLINGLYSCQYRTLFRCSSTSSTSSRRTATCRCMLATTGARCVLAHIVLESYMSVSLTSMAIALARPLTLSMRTWRSSSRQGGFVLHRQSQWHRLLHAP